MLVMVNSLWCIICIYIYIYIYIAMNYVTMYCELNYIYGLCTLLWTFISYMGYIYIIYNILTRPLINGLVSGKSTGTPYFIRKSMVPGFDFPFNQSSEFMVYELRFLWWWKFDVLELRNGGLNGNNILFGHSLFYVFCLEQVWFTDLSWRNGGSMVNNGDSSWLIMRYHVFTDQPV